MKEIYTRTSVRRFEDRPVEPEKVEALLRAAMQAPTAGNQQPWEFYVVTNKEILRQLSKVSPYAGPTAGAPLAIVMAYRSNGRFPVMAQIDCAIATENIWLEAETQGLGAVMLGIAPERERMEAVRAVLQLPAELEAFTILPVGYAAEKRPQTDRFDPSRIHTIA